MRGYRRVYSCVLYLDMLVLCVLCVLWHCMCCVLPCPTALRYDLRYTSCGKPKRGVLCNCITSAKALYNKLSINSTREPRAARGARRRRRLGAPPLVFLLRTTGLAGWQRGSVGVGISSRLQLILYARPKT